MKWFGEHKLFSVITGIIIVLVVMITASNLTGGGSGVFGRGIQSVVAVIEKPVETVAGSIGNTISGMANFRATQKENAELQAENERLKKENTKLKLSKDELAQLKHLSRALNYTAAKKAKRITSANVIVP